MGTLALFAIWQIQPGREEKLPAGLARSTASD